MEAARTHIELSRTQINVKIRALGLDPTELRAMWRTHWGVTDDNILFNMNRQLLNAIGANDAGYIFTELLQPIEGISPLGRAIWASTADFFGAMTKNRVGWGHSRAY